jgi:hypothetical protein
MEKRKTCPEEFRPPFKAIPQVSSIFDADDNLVVTVRGWGHLTGSGLKNHNLTSIEASVVHARFAEWIADAMNRAAQSEKRKKRKK